MGRSGQVSSSSLKVVKQYDRSCGYINMNISLGYATGTNNEAIDADLTNEY